MTLSRACLSFAFCYKLKSIIGHKCIKAGSDFIAINLIRSAFQTGSLWQYSLASSMNSPAIIVVDFLSFFSLRVLLFVFVCVCVCVSVLFFCFLVFFCFVLFFGNV